MQTKIITATPVAEIDQSGLTFYVTVGEPIDVHDLCEFEGAQIENVQGADRLDSDLSEQYEQGTIVKLEIVDAN